MDSEGFVYITGRIKEQYKLENGKYVVPAPLEELLQLSPYINQVFVYGMNRPFNVCLVVPDQDSIESWAAEQGKTGAYEDILADSDARALIESELAKCGAGFKGYERPRKFDLLADEFSVENGMLTPKMSLKRRIVLESYQDRVDALYN